MNAVNIALFGESKRLKKGSWKGGRIVRVVLCAVRLRMGWEIMVRGARSGDRRKQERERERVREIKETERQRQTETDRQRQRENETEQQSETETETEEKHREMG
jgi:hypothetical protein